MLELACASLVEMFHLRHGRALLWGIVAILFWTLMPGTWEVLENVSHLAVKGHLAHADIAEHEHSEPGDEHGCSGTLHLCPCHVSPMGLLFLGKPRLPVLSETSQQVATAVPELLSGYGHPPERPPSAGSSIS